jgi:NTP pyrophosphatase (non-canonical NTP hydrolase)
MKIRDLEFVALFAAFSERVHDWAVGKGFWEGGDRNDGEAIALMHSELSEALEGLRHGNPPSDHIPEFSAAEEELADCIIRIMDLASARHWRVGEAIVAKMAFNDDRPYKHGKEF